MGENGQIEGRRNLPSARPEYGEEVELIDYLRVLWKYRFWIIGATIFSALAVLVVSFIFSPIWEVSMVVEPGRLSSDVSEIGGNRPRGDIHYLDTARNMKGKIDQGAYDNRVRINSGWPSNEKIKWDVDFERGTVAMRVSLKVKDKELGLKALKVLTELIKKDYARRIAAFNEEIDEEIAIIRANIVGIEKDTDLVETKRDAQLADLKEGLNRLKKEIALLRQRESELSQEQESVRKNTELLMAKRNSLMEAGQSRNDPLALVLYTTSIQQNIAYSNKLAGQVNDVKHAIEEKESSVKKGEIKMVSVKQKAFSDIKKLESNIQKLGASIKAFETRKKFAEPIEIIQEPTVSHKPVKPKKRLNAIIAGILGLFISVFGAFFTEYISVRKEKVISNSRHGS